MAVARKAEGREERLFAPDKVEWLLAGGLESLDGGERQFLLVMAETRLQEGYRPDAQEKELVSRLRELAGQDYDAKDIKRKVRAMVKGPKKDDPPGLSLPATFDHLLDRLRNRKQE
jgi:hypothetical protein